MADLTLVTYDWVPNMPRGFVRDIRARWALEEAGLPYRVQSVSFRERKADHFAHQPFGQVPWLLDGDISVFESGAILLHLAEKSEVLMPKAPHVRSKVIQWLFAALNSVEAATQPWVLMNFVGDTSETPGRKLLNDFVRIRLEHTEKFLTGREWLVEGFTVADLLLADVLRVVDRFDGLAKYPACRDYVARATNRPAFVKAHADQMAHFAAADPKE